MIFHRRFLRKAMPMGLNSTHYLSYHDIDLTGTDLIEDAFRLNCEFNDVITFLRNARFEQDNAVYERLIDRFRNRGC